MISSPCITASTPGWTRHSGGPAAADVDLGAAADLVSLYQQEGPTERGAHVLPAGFSWLGFTADACYTLLLGQRVPYRKTFEPSDDELRELAMFRLENRALGASIPKSPAAF